MKHIHVSPTIPFTSEIPSEKALESFVSLHRCYETGGDNVERKTEIEREREREREIDKVTQTGKRTIEKQRTHTDGRFHAFEERGAHTTLRRFHSMYIQK